ncbi:MAG: glycosyltransferase family 2 protein [Bernardetiaceae bacterium]|nr:glycosyltransferase family 2 protein [Bernardetiaceae bacterium]
MPQISVLLPFYNAEKTLYRAAKSILAQTYTDFELLLINNASSDESPRVAQQLAIQDRRVRLLQMPQKGIVYALNFGIEQSQSPYIARMDADDYAYPNRFEKQINFIYKNLDLDLVSSKVRQPQQEGREGYAHYVDWINSLLTPEQITQSQFVESPLAHPTVLFRRSMLDKIGNYREGDFPEDYDLWLRALAQGSQFGKVPEVLLDWNDHSERLSRQDERYSVEAFYRLKTQYLVQWLERHNPFFPKVCIWGAGKQSKKRAAWLVHYGIEILHYIDIKPHKPDTLYFEDIAPAGNYFILSYVANRGAREQINHFLAQRHYIMGKHFLNVS